ncbi:hypothetical protein LguiA_008025 [Lonicera macranthoides]
MFQNVTRNIAASENEIAELNTLYLDFIKFMQETKKGEEEMEKRDPRKRRRGEMEEWYQHLMCILTTRPPQPRSSSAVQCRPPPNSEHFFFFTAVVLRWKLNFHPLASLSSTRSIVLFDKVKYKKMLEKHGVDGEVMGKFIINRSVNFSFGMVKKVKKGWNPP